MASFVSISVGRNCIPSRRITNPSFNMRARRVTRWDSELVPRQRQRFGRHLGKPEHRSDTEREKIILFRRPAGNGLPVVTRSVSEGARICSEPRLRFGLLFSCRSPYGRKKPRKSRYFTTLAASRNRNLPTNSGMVQNVPFWGNRLRIGSVVF